MSTAAAIAVALATPRAAPPVDITRSDGTRAAREELSKQIYVREEPGLVSATLSWLHDQLDRFVATAVELVPGGLWILLVLPVLLLMAFVLIRWRVGPLARSRTARSQTPDPIFEAPRHSAAEHRLAADAAAANGDFDVAVPERFRALVRDLEERSLLQPAPGRTASEVAHVVASFAPEAGEPLREAARGFDEVRYGGRTPNAHTDALVRAADEAARAVQPGRGDLAGVSA